MYLHGKFYSSNSMQSHYAITLCNYPEQSPCACNHPVRAITLCVQSPCACNHPVRAITLCVQSPCACNHPVRAITLCNHPVQSPCAITLCVQSFYAITLCNHPMQSPCAITLCNHPMQSPYAITLCNHPKQSPYAITLCYHPVQQKSVEGRNVLGGPLGYLTDSTPFHIVRKWTTNQYMTPTDTTPHFSTPLSKTTAYSITVVCIE